MGEEQSLAASPVTGVPITQPRIVDIREVSNGYTVQLRGGQRDLNKPYFEHTHVALNWEDAIKIAQDFFKKD